MNRSLWTVLVPACLALAPAGCRRQHHGLSPEELQLGPPPPAALLENDHRGPRTAAGPEGTARYAALLLEGFDEESARELLEFVDGSYRAPGNDGYEAVLERLAADLAAAGFGRDPGLELAFLESELTAVAWGSGRREPAPAWTPIAARLSLLVPGEPERELHAFSDPGGRDRTMLPVYAPAADVEGGVARGLGELDQGEVLVVAAAPTRSLLNRAQALGACGVVSAYLEGYNTDPTGGERHLDAVQFRTLPQGLELPVLMISPRSLEAIDAALERDAAVRLRLEATVELAERPLRTLVATVRGTDRPGEAVVIASHVQEPGACDNASGVVGLAESARTLARLLGEGAMARPSRSVVFLWGDEFRQSESYLDAGLATVVAALSSDMTGESRERTGAIFLLERMPDPGALVPLPPDEHTPWGKREVEADSLVPNGLAVIARCAIADVALADGGWSSAEHPYEGGSDHDVYIARGIPSALFWHFTDFAYHTSLDRLEHVDPGEVRRTAAAILATALALADPRPADLDRYLRTLDQERILRVAAAEGEGEAELARRWTSWCEGARHWLRVECLRIPPSER